MRPGKTVLELVLLLRPLMGRVMLRRMAPRVALLVGLAFLAIFFGALALLVVFYTGYLAVMKYFALTQLQALLALLGSVLLMLLGCVVAVRMQLSRLRPNPFAPIEQVAETVDAFIDGFKRPGA